MYTIEPADCPEAVKAECQPLLSRLADALGRPELTHARPTRAMLMEDLFGWCRGDAAFAEAWGRAAARLPVHAEPRDLVDAVARRLREFLACDLGGEA